MTRMIRLSPSGIEYLDYVWNFYSGCKHKEQGKCPPVPCWAEELCHRFKGHYPQGFAPTFYPEAFLSPLALKGEGKRIGVCFMGDLFGDWVDAEKDLHDELKDIFPTTWFMPGPWTLIEVILRVIENCPQHTFIFLTKNPAGMIPWSPFPDNCQVGFSAWSPESFIDGLREISWVEAKVKWCSLEPLLDWTDYYAGNAWELLDWVVLGALTGTKGQMMELAPKYPALTPWKLSAKGNRWGLMPPVAWLKTIVEGCDAAKVPVFLKDNLLAWLLHDGITNKDADKLFWNREAITSYRTLITLRQELPGHGKADI